MSPISNAPVAMGIPGRETKEHFDTKAVTSELVTAPVHSSVAKSAPDCSLGVQTVFYPPIALEPVLKTRTNPFRKHVLWRYPFLVNKDSLYDKTEKIFRDPEETLSTYKRDYGCESGDIELVRSTASQVPLPDLSPKRYPTLEYIPKNTMKISKEMSGFYTLPGGRWSLNARDKPRRSETLSVNKYVPPKWESEYQANINGLADYMSKMKVLTRKTVKVHRVSTLPDF